MSEMFSRPSKKSHLDTIHYEIQMLYFCMNWLSHFGNKHRDAELVYLECFLLHYRNLANFFSGKGGSSGDLSINNPQVWAGRAVSKAERDAIQHPATELYTHSADISTYLAHCTKKRYESDRGWKPREMLREMEPVIKAFEEAFPSSTNSLWTKADEFRDIECSTVTVARWRPI